MKQIKNELQKLPTYNQMTSENINKHLKKFVSTVVAKYEDLTNFDKIYQAQANVEQVQLMMEDNMKKMLNNQVNIQVRAFLIICEKISKLLELR